MASWKEKGVVPDSEDEDYLDSHSITNCGDRNERNSSLHVAHDSTNHGKEQTRGNEVDEKKISQKEMPLEGNISSNQTDGNAAIGILDSSTPITDSQLLCPPSSPASPRIFKVPEPLSDLDCEPADSENKSTRNPKNQIPADILALEDEKDEISKSYVRLISPISSIISSIQGRQQDVVPNEHLTGSELEASYSQRMSYSSSHATKPTSTDPTPHAMQEPLPLNRRSLRQRNPIQLHPYIVEQEKYRRTLKARGVVPMRFVQTQDEQHTQSQDTASSDASLQILEEQEVEESQPMNFDWDSVPSSLGQNFEDNIERSESDEGFNSDDDNEFPDVNELLRVRQSAAQSQQMERKRKMKSYYLESRRPQLPRIRTQGTGTTEESNKAASIFDIPASPPATSSPFATVAQSIGKPTSHTISISSKEPTPSWLDQDEPRFHAAADLPTPVTSAIKQASGPGFSESDLDDDPFATELDNQTSSSSSDESIQIRKVGKKIRGVLPASHLRLDQQLKKSTVLTRNQRDAFSLSPAKLLARRGVALPKMHGAMQIPSPVMNNGNLLFPDYSEDEEKESQQNGLFMEEVDSLGLDDLPSKHRMGYAEEDDRIDAMLPSRKRHRSSNAQARKKIRLQSTSSPQARGKRYPNQPNTTEHLVKTHKSTSKCHANGRSSYRASSRMYKSTSVPYRRKDPPKLGILDVMDSTDLPRKQLPQFIKVAARTARSRFGQGRQSPSKKFIRLANREDTYDAQSMLLEWKQGKIKPRNLGRSLMGQVEALKAPLDRIVDNHQTPVQPPMSKTKPRLEAVKIAYGHLGMPRQLTVSKGKQRSINDFMSITNLGVQQFADSTPAPRRKSTITQRLQGRPRFGAPQSRPAQLESSEAEFGRRNPTFAFKTTKRSLDAIFRLGRRRPVTQTNLQLNRFLVDDNLLLPSVETSPLSTCLLSPVAKKLSIAPGKSESRQRKRLPQRVDVGATRYRQPSETLILDFLAPIKVQESSAEENKLIGLGKFGVQYSTQFDIFPLQAGIFFHESTFIGSGHLSEALRGLGTAMSDVLHPYFSFRLGDKDFRWGPWNAEVSSEIGLVFDCLLEQLIPSSPGLNVSYPKPDVLMTSMVRYVQHHLSLADSENRSNFLTRMLEVLLDFSSRLEVDGDPSCQGQDQDKIEVLSRCTVYIMQLLQLSRAEQSVVTCQMEDLLKSVAGLCVKLLVHQGLDCIRSLYDDLQYLSFRECGIKTDNYAAHAWVVVLRVLTAARIPKASFWDIANPYLAVADVNLVSDASVMEKIWYSIFSLLPLCEFDDFGVVIPGLRLRTSFENWSLPQQMLRRVFALYSLNTRQSPNFNDYCRAILSRCHVLMCKWGWWKCSGMIGTLFDFFASQNLGNLRNEEVYESPRFLEELDTEPSLDVEPEDRSFHVFLKIVAAAIKNMRRAGDEKGVRNLITRLLPNHDRQYPKEESIHQRELAALRNHHDLLCTLYWVSPPDKRPSVNLIQDLVVADLSHKEACLINLRAWSNLARFVFTSPGNHTAFQPLVAWQRIFFAKLLRLFLEADSEVRRQADLLPMSNELSISETQLQKMIVSNRRSIMAALLGTIHNLCCNIKTARDANAAMVALNDQLLCSILDPGVCGISNDPNENLLNQNLVDAAINALDDYMTRVDELHPFGSLQFTSNRTEADSQESLDLENVDIERQMMVHPLHDTVLPKISAIARQVLEYRLYQSNEPSFMADLIHCWARLVSLVTEEKYELRHFLVSGPNAVFEHRRGCIRANIHWPLFLSELLKYKGIDDLRVAGCDLGLEWMLAITRPPTFPDYEPSLTGSLSQKGHYLLKPNAKLSSCGWLSATDRWPHRNRNLVQIAVSSMREILHNPKHADLATNSGLSRKETRGLFAAMLKGTMDSMQQQLESMMPSSMAHLDYVKFCQDVVIYIRAFASEIRPLTDFFVRPSTHYWPKGDDPQLYAAGIVSYSLRLRDQPGKASFELFHYLYSGWKNDQLHSRLDNHITYVLKGMKQWYFTEFMLANFVPATLCVGFNCEGGCVLPKTYLPALAKRLPHFLMGKHPEAAITFTHLINILKMIVNGIRIQNITASLRRNDAHNEHRGILSIVCQFWIAVQPALREYVELHPSETPILEEVTGAFNTFFQKAVRCLDEGVVVECGVVQLGILKGDFVERFVAALHDDIENHWVFVEDTDLIRIKVTGARDGGTTEVSAVEGVPTLYEVLKLGLSLFGETGPPEGCPVWLSPSSLSPGGFPGPFDALF